MAPLLDPLSDLEPGLRSILERALEGRELSILEGERLCRARGTEIRALVAVADEVRARQCGPLVTYVVNRNISIARQCIHTCSFCAFSRKGEEPMSIPEIVARAREAAQANATEICLQAGLSPQLDGWFYVQVVGALKQALPNLRLHAFSPEEILYGARRAGVSVRDYLAALKDAGHDTLPGTSAEILDDDVRCLISPERMSTAAWVEVVATAHALGMRTSATIMYGHVENYGHWMRHMVLLRDLQKQTGGFTEFVPLSFVHQRTPLYRQRLVASVRPGPTGVDVLKMHAVARLMLGATIRNIQVSWVKEGLRMAQCLLLAGANDLGGTLMEETISSSAGANHGQSVEPEELRRLAYDLGRVPAERTSTYDLRQIFDEAADARAQTPLDEASASAGEA